MSEHSIDHSQGYLKCLDDLSVFSNTKLDLFSHKKLRDNFILPNIEKHTQNIGTILNEMYEESKKGNRQ